MTLKWQARKFGRHQIDNGNHNKWWHWNGKWYYVNDITDWRIQLSHYSLQNHVNYDNAPFSSSLLGQLVGAGKASRGHSAHVVWHTP